VTIERGRAAATSWRTAVNELGNGDSRIGRQVRAAEARPVVLSSGVDGFVKRSDEGSTILAPVLDSIAASAQVVSLIAIAGCAWLSAASRRRELALSLSMGARPSRVAAIAAIEQLPAIAVGVAAAYAVVRWWPFVIAGDGAMASDTLDHARQVVIWTMPAALAVIAFVTLVVAWRLDPTTSDRTRRLLSVVRPETITVVAAVVTGAQILTQRGSVLDSGFALVFPLFAVLAGAIVIVRVLATLITRFGGRRTSSNRQPRSLTWWFARRRVTSGLAQLGAVVIVIGVGVGMFTYCTAVASNGERTVSDKQAVIGGAQATVAIARSAELDAERRFVAPTDRSTVVWLNSSAYFGPTIASDVLMVDPATFADGVEWRDSFADRPLADLLAELEGDDESTIDVIVSGTYADALPDAGLMDLYRGAALMRYRVVARVDALPWQRERATMMIVSAPALARLVPTEDGTLPGPRDTTGLDRVFPRYVWADMPQAELRQRLDAAVIATDEQPPNLASAAREPTFVAFGQSLPYVRLVGLAMLIVSVIAVIVLGQRRRAELAVELAIGRQVGLRRRVSTWAAVLAALALAVVGWLIGTLVAAGLTRFMLARLDPASSLPPGFQGSLGITTMAGALAIVAFVSVLGVAAELAGARRRPVSEVMRGAE
jgi:putative ABC transport system permease protein